MISKLYYVLVVCWFITDNISQIKKARKRETTFIIILCAEVMYGMLYAPLWYYAYLGIWGK